MDISLSKDQETRAQASLQRYFSENLGEEIGTLQAHLLLRFFLEEIGPCVYNRAVADAQGFLQEKLGDLENTCFAQEFNHWKAPAKGKRP